MIPTEARRLMTLYAAPARDAESDATAEANISMLAGMLGYAAACGHLAPAEHANEWTLIKLIREQRIDARKESRYA